ncbi:MAG: choice-of-anchor Q domain-containing protein [Dokdonella sp.]
MASSVRSVRSETTSPGVSGIPAPDTVVIDAGVSRRSLSTGPHGASRPSGADCEAGAFEVNASIVANAVD